MTDPAAPDAPIESPCIGICRMDAGRDFCTGCFRTLEEIGCWQMYSEADKRTIIARLAERRAANINDGHD
ncbi:DUF1289 domain-containing protein [bacterium]|nr:DUF1289 domain-containing protein [bacterium]